MKYIVNVSGGAGSTVAAHRAVYQKGEAECIFVFADTGSEHPDTTAMVDHLFDKAFPKVESYKLKYHTGDIWDFFDSHGMIRQKSTCLASTYLKKQVLDEFYGLFFHPEKVVSVTGLDWMEPERIERLNRARRPIRCWHPLSEDPKLDRCELTKLVGDMGYPKQSLYERGYPHNNCGGSCVLAGVSQWAGLYEDDKERFLYAAKREKQFQELNKSDFTVLRDRRGGVTKSMTLFELEDRIINDDLKGMRDFRSTCSCMTGE